MRSWWSPWPALVLTLLFGTGASCLGGVPPTPAGDWEGSCSLQPAVPFTLSGLLLVTEGEGVLVDATGTWALFQGEATWGSDSGAVDLAQCTDDSGCTLQESLYRPDAVIVLFYITGDPALVGTFDGETMSGECFANNEGGDFDATRPERN